MTSIDGHRAEAAEAAVTRWRETIAKVLPPKFNVNPRTVAEHVGRLTELASRAEPAVVELTKTRAIAGMLYGMLGKIHFNPEERPAYEQIMAMAAEEFPEIAEMAAKFDAAAGGNGDGV